VSGLVSHGMDREEAEREAARRVRQGLAEVTSGSPRGLPDPSVRPAVVPTGRPSGPAARDDDLSKTHNETMRRGATSESDPGTCPGCGELVDDKDPNVVVINPQGQLAHRVCPDDALLQAAAP
jgi:hypothetical protein